MQDARTIHDQIRKILLDDWDPTGASRSEYAAGEYDAYIRPLWDLVQCGATEEAVVDFLYEREREITCFPALGKQRLRRVARKLIALKG
jgi:hypothetical protein